MCALLEVSSSGFYEWRGRPLSATAERREELKFFINQSFDESDETYGYRRVHADLVDWVYRFRTRRAVLTCGLGVWSGWGRIARRRREG
jgi:transposase InsO family protein